LAWDWRLSQLQRLYHQAGVFDKAHRLVEKHRQRAEKIADEVEPEPLRALLYYLVDSVLDHHAAPPPPQLTTIH
jgi:geranylgeranyl pyrophosphate synthase